MFNLGLFSIPLDSKQQTSKLRKSSTQPGRRPSQCLMNQITNRCVEYIRPIPSIFDKELNQLRDNDWDDTSKAVVQ
ncbi:hypothetical protein KP79_PYT18518 [Mizuhopecten yessoensis]|uniref:Uncharacterized protein n=1 Tax=Mizuhopecten yessoensis TaxID=6573 RepID=A0A210QUD4_MIZYE|nr:hypothetical protein KP79_PYT18518 [Mizuhopecten yessoensis]